MRRLAAMIIAGVLCAALAVPALAATRTVLVGPETSFGPRSLTISRGDTVRFRWTGDLPHNVRVTRAPATAVKFTISTRMRGTVPKRFTRSGRYTLVCEIHAPDMRMTIRVR